MPATLSVITNVPDVITLFESFKRFAQDHLGFSQGFHLSDALNLGIDEDDFGWLLETFKGGHFLEFENLFDDHSSQRYQFALAALPQEGERLLQNLTKLRDKQGNPLLESAVITKKINGSSRLEKISLFAAGYAFDAGAGYNPDRKPQPG